MGCVVAYVRIHSSLLALLRRPQRDFIFPPPCLDQGAGTIAFAIRSGVNLVLLLARIKNFPKYGSIPCSGESQLAET